MFFFIFLLLLSRAIIFSLGQMHSPINLTHRWTVNDKYVPFTL